MGGKSGSQFELLPLSLRASSPCLIGTQVPTSTCPAAGSTQPVLESTAWSFAPCLQRSLPLSRLDHMLLVEALLSLTLLPPPSCSCAGLDEVPSSPEALASTNPLPSGSEPQPSSSKKGAQPPQNLLSGSVLTYPDQSTCLHPLHAQPDKLLWVKRASTTASLL
eukprot:2527229-Amphidinium_carterae.1